MENREKIEKLKSIRRALYMIDMNNGFVNYGAMANNKYNDLVPEQLKLIKAFRGDYDLINFILEGHVKDSLEFKTYPEHCVLGTGEAELIPEFILEQNKKNTFTYYKNCINGMLNMNVLQDIKLQENLREAVFAGVCADLCVMDFVRTYARYMDELNRDVNLFVVRNTIDTFDAPGHSRDEWMKISEMVMAQAGVRFVDDFEELKREEKKLGLRK